MECVSVDAADVYLCPSHRLPSQLSSFFLILCCLRLRVCVNQKLVIAEATLSISKMLGFFFVISTSSILIVLRRKKNSEKDWKDCAKAIVISSSFEIRKKVIRLNHSSVCWE
jgi:hypothetical protein